MNYIKNAKSLGLVAVEDQVKNYEKYGFEVFNKLYRCSRIAHGTVGKNLVNIRDVALERLVEYDTARFGDSRKALLQALRQEEAHDGFIYLENDNIRGYGFIRGSDETIKIGPFVADDRETSKEIINELQSQRTGKQVIIDVRESSSDLQ